MLVTDDVESFKASKVLFAIKVLATERYAFISESQRVVIQRFRYVVSSDHRLSHKQRVCQQATRSIYTLKNMMITKREKKRKKMIITMKKKKEKKEDGGG